MIKKYLFEVAAVLVLISSILYITKWEWAPYMYAVGTAGIAVYHLTNRYEGSNLRKKRLHRILGFAGMLMVLSSYFMFKHQGEWIITLLISACLHLYASFVMPKE